MVTCGVSPITSWARDIHWRGCWATWRKLMASYWRGNFQSLSVLQICQKPHMFLSKIRSNCTIESKALYGKLSAKCALSSTCIFLKCYFHRHSDFLSGLPLTPFIFCALFISSFTLLLYRAGTGRRGPEESLREAGKERAGHPRPGGRELEKKP